MNEAISAVLTYAVGVALSPIPTIAVILVLFSPRARVNGLMFLAGWAGGLAALMTVVVLMGDRLGAGAGARADDGIAWARVLLGVVLLVAATRKWRERPGPAEEPSLPAWMARIDRFTPAQVFGVGLLLSANPKNLALALGGGLSLAQLGVPARQAGAAIVAFVLVGSAGVIASVSYALTGGVSARQWLDEAKAWLVLHNGALMAALYLVFGALLVSRGLEPRT